MRRETAQYVSGLMLRVAGELNDSVARCDEAENGVDSSAYRKSVAHVMQVVLVEILNPIYREHPDLRPEQLDPTW